MPAKAHRNRLGYPFCTNDDGFANDNSLGINKLFVFACNGEEGKRFTIAGNKAPANMVELQLNLIARNLHRFIQWA